MLKYHNINIIAIFNNTIPHVLRISCGDFRVVVTLPRTAVFLSIVDPSPLLSKPWRSPPSTNCFIHTETGVLSPNHEYMIAAFGRS